MVSLDCNLLYIYSKIRGEKMEELIGIEVHPYPTEVRPYNLDVQPRFVSIDDGLTDELPEGPGDM